MDSGLAIAVPKARIGPYTLVRRLGGGAMGDVFEAEHTQLGHRVAIKVVRVSSEEGGDALRRALREGRAANAVVHPNVVKVLDTGSHEGAPYLVMELLEGEDLGRLLAREGHLPLGRIAALMLPVIAGVAAAHDSAIIHRDLKPSNVVLARRHRDIEPVVVDFGISRSLNGSVETMASARGAGTVLYMAPEQLRARTVTAKADQYALGVMLYELATGGTPFYEEDHYALLHAIMTAQVVPPSELVPGLPGAFDALVLRALERDPDARFASVHELGAALAWMSDEAIRARFSDPAALSETLLDFSAPRGVGARARTRWAPLGVAVAASMVVAAVAFHRAPVEAAGGTGPIVASTEPGPQRADKPLTMEAPSAIALASTAPSLEPVAPGPVSTVAASPPPASRPSHPARSRPKPEPPEAHAAPPAAAPPAGVERGTANIPIVE